MVSLLQIKVKVSFREPSFEVFLPFHHFSGVLATAALWTMQQLPSFTSHGATGRRWAADGRANDLCGFLKLIIQSSGFFCCSTGGLADRGGGPSKTEELSFHPPLPLFFSSSCTDSLPLSPDLLHYFLSSAVSFLLGAVSFCLGSLGFGAGPLVPARSILHKVHYAVSVRRQSFLMS